MTFSIDNPRGVTTTPLRKICFGKTLRRTRVKGSLVNYSKCQWSIILIIFYVFGSSEVPQVAREPSVESG